MSSSFWLFIMFSTIIAVQSDPSVILSFGGGVIGRLITTPNGFVGQMFLGIPFAKPPVGQLRFADPIAMPFWNGNLTAQQYSPACYQNSTVYQTDEPISEDCLYLNVFTSERCLNGRNCPVLFYTHGGANEIGSTRNFPEDVLVDNYVSKGIVVVTNNYRMGVLGFWNAGNMDGSGNFAIKDILLSLQWAQREIVNFGGDAKRTSLMGYSSSAIVISSLTLSPRTEGLFDRVILISGTNFVPDSFNNSQERNKFLAETSGCDKDGHWGTPNVTGLLDCLRNVSLERLNDIYVNPDPHIAADFFQDDFHRYFDEGEPTPFYDGPDGIFPESLEQLRLKRRPVATFLGTTSREYSFDDTFNTTEANVTGKCKEAVRISNYHNPSAVVQACVKSYIRRAKDNITGLPPDHIHSAMDFATLAIENDIKWYVPTYEEANSMSATGAKVFLYQFEYFEPEKDGIKPSHADDLKYISGNHHSILTAGGLEIRRIYSGLIVNFVKFANPNGRKRARKPWVPVKNGVRLNYNVIDLPQPRMEVGYHLQGVLFWKFVANEVDLNASSNQTSIRSVMIAVVDTQQRQHSSVPFWLIAMCIGMVIGTMVLATLILSKVRRPKNQPQLLIGSIKTYSTFNTVRYRMSVEKQ